jgi:hypothetical protein
MEDAKNQREIAGPGPRSDGCYNNRRPGSWKDWLKLLALVSVVVLLGMLAVNQSLEFFYRAELLKSPCKLCWELNPGVESCIQELNKKESYPDGLGGWTDPFKDQDYNITIKK